MLPKLCCLCIILPVSVMTSVLVACWRAAGPGSSAFPLPGDLLAVGEMPWDTDAEERSCRYLRLL